jgi:hypothetical protein
MLGHGALGVWALGQLPGVQSGAAAAPGAVLPLHLALLAGAASGQGQIVIIGGGAPPRWNAAAPGAVLRIRLMLVAGSVAADATPRGVVLSKSVGLAAGKATADAVGYDNDFVLLEAA